MRAMILAAGRGERMGELTRNTPKALLRVNGFYLIEHSIFNIVRAGITEIVINISYHGEQIKSALGDGSRYGAKIIYSEEEERLETGGGILKALPLLGNDPFLVVSCDIITNYPLTKLLNYPAELAHLIMVDNPPYHPAGDFALKENHLEMNATPTLTFASMSVLTPNLFANAKPGHFRLADLLIPAVLNRQVTGEYFKGSWFNIGTPNDLDEVTLSGFHF